MSKNTKKIFSSNQTGFSILEILIAISIISLMSGVMLANYRGAGSLSKFNNTIQRIASDIRLVESYTLGFKEKTSTGEFPKAGWGIRFDRSAPNQYIIFADEDESAIGCANKTFNSGEEESVVQLPDSIEISAISLAGNYVDIVFLPPDPLTCINQADSQNVTITFRDIKTGAIKNILVNKFGLIEIQ